ncbi:MAG: hypothetical protein HFI09_00480 [Bacilli bacterium]|nr:hypothetical protein [Bacilli bacterium]
MILVALGTQDREFTRLLDAVEKQIKLGNIKEKVIVQAGETKYQSDYMEIFDLIPSREFTKLLEECRLLITHGGVGTIIDGLNHHKKIIAAARLCEYGEHKNNHQKQIISEFTKKQYILELDDFEHLDEKLKEIEDFKPKAYESNTMNFIHDLESYIDEELKDHRGDHLRKFMIYGFFVFLGILLQLGFVAIFSSFLDFYQSVYVSFFLLIIYRLVMHCLFFPGKLHFWEEACFFILLIAQLFLVFFFPSIFLPKYYWRLFLLFGASGFISYFLSLLFPNPDGE